MKKTATKAITKKTTTRTMKSNTAEYNNNKDYKENYVLYQMQDDISFST